MSVEIAGPKGYEWQYRVTSLLAVKHLDAKQLVVEAASGEDAQLHLFLDERLTVIDLQAKSGQSEIHADSLVDWLGHFSSRSAERSLLGKLKQGVTIAVFICAGRSTDAVKAFIRPFGDFQTHADIAATTVATVLTSLKENIDSLPTETELQRNRQKHLKLLHAEFLATSGSLEKALGRIILWESVTERQIESIFHSLLTARHLIPTFACKDVVLSLDNAVRAARNDRADVLPQIRTILEKASPNALLCRESHLSRGDEDALLKELSEKQVLLLTGQSMCGKSNMAKFLADQYQAKGVVAKIGHAPEEAQRSLTISNSQPQIFVLEDPFTHADARTVVSHVDTLRRLFLSLPNYRFIIVTSKSSDIPGIAHNIAGHEWKDLTIRDPRFLIRFWDRVMESNPSLTDIRDNIEKSLASTGAEQPFQPGHLLHLSHLDNLKGCTGSELIKLARFDITDLAYTWQDHTPHSRRLHLAICLGATPVQRMRFDELRFILSDSQARPGFSDQIGVTYSFRPRKHVFPDYPELPPLEPGITHELSLLEKSGQIRMTSRELWFSHPDYASSSLAIALSFTGPGIETMLHCVERSLSSVHEPTAIQSVEVLGRMYDTFSSIPEQKKAIFDVALAARRSIFPAVRDVLFTLMLKWANTLDRDALLELFRQREPVDLSFGVINWHSGVPWTDSERSFVETVPDDLEQRNFAVDLRISQFSNVGSNITIESEEAWFIVNYLHCRPVDPQMSKAASELLKQPYAFIRSRCFETLLGRFINDCPLYLASLQCEQSSGVVRTAAKTCLWNWHNTSDDTKQLLTPWLEGVFSHPPFAICCSDLLTYFGDPHAERGPDWSTLSAEDRTSLWRLWAELVQKYLNAIASQPYEHNASRLYDTLKVAHKYVDPSLLSSVASAWVLWIEGQLEMRLLDDYELAVAELILQTQPIGSTRVEMLERLLCHCDTALVVTTIHFMIESWEALASAEKQLLCATLSATREDSNWLRGVAITRKVVPEEVQQLLTGADDRLSASSEELVGSLSPSLLSHALHVYCGEPQPLWYIGLHHSSRTPWHNILAVIATNPDHPDFDLALNATLLPVVLDDKDAALSCWGSLCDRGPTVRARLYKHLLRYTVSVNWPSADGFWEKLFASAATDGEVRQLVSGIIDNLEQISRNMDDVSAFFGQDAFNTLLLPELERESRFCALCDQVRQAGSDDERRPLLGQLTHLLEKMPPRFLHLFDIVPELISECLLPEATRVLQENSDARSRFFEISEKQQNEIECKKKIWNWGYGYAAPIKSE